MDEPEATPTPAPELAPEVAPETAADVPQPEADDLPDPVAPEAPTEAPEVAPAEAPAFVTVVYHRPPGTHTPVVTQDGGVYTMEQVAASPMLANRGAYWHEGTEQALPAADASALVAHPGFSVIGPATPPAVAPTP